MLMAEPSTYDKFESCHMLTAEPLTYDNFSFNLLETQKNNMSYVDGSAINTSVLFQKCKHFIC